MLLKKVDEHRHRLWPMDLIRLVDAVIRSRGSSAARAFY
jgi:hypothetical protein